MDITSLEVRQRVLSEINGDENKRRKQESLKRLEIYREMQRKYILERLVSETSQETVSRMRTFTSVNLAKKIINEIASVYKKAPKREIENADPEQEYYVNETYKRSGYNVAFKKANKAYKLQGQCALQVVPSLKDGKIIMRVLHPHHYDVIPAEHDPEQAYCYIVSSYDKEYNDQFVGSFTDNSESRNRSWSSYSDKMNQKIGDPEDYKTSNVFYWWSAEYNFKTDSKGFILDDNNMPLQTVDFNDLLNPIGELNFIDIASEKDYEFFVKGGGSVTDFQIDFGVLLSDITDINRLQGYSQAVISSVEKPKELIIGPHKVIHLKINPNEETATRPTFEFVTPSPDMQSSLNLSDKLLYMFLSSLGVDPKSISTTGAGQNYSSAYERLLAAIEKFEVSEDDFELFKGVEYRAFELFKKWNNVLVDANMIEGEMLPEEAKMEIIFLPPSTVLSESDETDIVIKQLENGLITRAEGIARLRKIDEKKAKELLKTMLKEDVEEMLELKEGVDGEGDEASI